MTMAVDPRILREAVSAAVWGLHSYSHAKLTKWGAELDWPLPDESAGSKTQRLEACLNAIADDQLQQTAQGLLGSTHLPVSRTTRFALEEAVWAAEPVIEIPGRVRREVARSINLDELITRQERFERLLDRLWVLDSESMALEALLGSPSTGLRAQIHQHVFRNPGDWPTEEFFEKLGVFEASSVRFNRFLEGMVDPSTLPDAAAQGRVVEAVNVPLARAGARLEQTGERDGFPHYQLVRTGPGANRRPKTLIFATTVKPDMRFVSVMDNDIEILQGMDHLLHYDRSVGADGLCWRDLQEWWQEKTGTTDEEEAKKSLYSRLLASMPDDSKSRQRDFYRAYHRIYGTQAPDLPALLPEIWLHWDHQTVQRRGVAALLNHRMDFLMLMPNGQRVVLEVDGSHHYATHEAYAKTVRGDRELKLRGYEVYRFSFAEFGPRDQLEQLLQELFTSLFERHNVTVSASH